MSVQEASRLGRPSKGQRVILYTRLPRPLATLFTEEAAAVGNSQSDHLALILMDRYGDGPTAREPQVPARTSRP